MKKRIVSGIVAGVLVAPAAGVVASAWLGEWRWAVTGLGVGVALLASAMVVGGEK